MKHQLRLVVVRHGETTYNKSRLISGWADVPLSEKGIKELKQYKKERDYPITDRYYASDLQRAKDSFEILFGDSHNLDGTFENFREVNFGGYDHRPIEENATHFYSYFLKDKSNLDGETYTEFRNRVWNQIHILFDQLIEDGLQSMTIVAHGGVGRITSFVLNKMRLEEYLDLWVENGLGFVFDIDYNPETKEMTLLQEREL